MAIKRNSITVIFLKYLLGFILTAPIVFAGFGAYFVYGINNGIILPADYIEKYIHDNKETLEKGIIDYREIP